MSCFSPLESSCPSNLLYAPGQGFHSWLGPRPPEGKREREREVGGGWKAQGAESRNKSVPLWTPVAALRVPSLNFALRIAVLHVEQVERERNSPPPPPFREIARVDKSCQ